MDCKVLIDDNASFRQKELFAMADKAQEDEMEVRAEKAQLNYIRLWGNIGCMGELLRKDSRFELTFCYILVNFCQLTEPAWRWRPWILLNCTVVILQIFWTSVAALQ